MVSVNSNLVFEARPKSLTSCGPKSGKTLFLYDQIKLYLKNQAVQIENVLSKNVYSEIRARYETRPTAQARFEEQFPDICLDWHDIYKLPVNVLIDTKSREFQFRILNRYLITNSFLYKLGLATFCKQESESLEHLLMRYSCTKSFWSVFFTWINQLNIFLRDFSDRDILFGFWQRKEDYLFTNHMLVLAKQRIYECRNKCTYPSFTIFLNKVSYVHQLEKKLMNSNNKLPIRKVNRKSFSYSAVVVRINMQKTHNYPDILL